MLRREQSKDKLGEFVTFDTDLIDHFKRLLPDFDLLPPFINSFNRPADLRRGDAWTMLSLGGPGSGLPFHVHGQTWLGLVFGEKQWFLYPPGYTVPPELLNTLPLSSFMGSLEVRKPRSTAAGPFVNRC